METTEQTKATSAATSIEDIYHDNNNNSDFHFKDRTVATEDGATFCNAEHMELNHSIEPVPTILQDCVGIENNADVNVNNSRDVNESHKIPHNAGSDLLITDLPKEIRNIIAGGIAGMLAKSVVAPVERIKILFQVSSAQFRFRSIPRIAKGIVEKEGFTALWKGNTATLIRVFPYAGIQFMVFDRCKKYFLTEHALHDHFLLTKTDAIVLEKDGKRKPNKYGLTPLESLVSGMLAGGISVVCTYPLDLARAQLAVLFKDKNHKIHLSERLHIKAGRASNIGYNLGFTGVLTENYKRRGFFGLFRGLTPTILGILPYAGIAFALNEQGKQKIQGMTGRDLKTIERMQCGAVAGLFAQTLTYPLEVTRRRMQTIGITPVSDRQKAATSAFGLSGATTDKALDTLGTMRALYVEQGIGGFFKGVSMNWLKGPIAFSISFTAFDIVQSMMETDKERSFRLIPTKIKALNEDRK